jgi:hypothetical protein
MLTVLLTIEPDRIAVDASSSSINNARYRFGELREPLAAFALSHLSPLVLDLAGQFDGGGRRRNHRNRPAAGARA